MNIIAQNIGRRRKELKMTQKELAEKLSISDKTVSRWETGNQIPDALTIPLIAEVLDMTIDELYGLEKKGESHGQEAEESQEAAGKDKPSDESADQPSEYPNLKYGRILAFKIALIVGVFCFVGISTFVAKNTVFYLGSWNLIYGMAFGGIILYFVICQIVFREFYKREALAFYYEEKHMIYAGASLLAVDVIFAMWMPWNYNTNFYSLVPYWGIGIAVAYNVFLLALAFLYIIRLKRKGFEVQWSVFLLPALLFVLSGIVLVVYGKYAGQSLRSSLGVFGTSSGENLTYNKMRYLAMTAGFFMTAAQAVTYRILRGIWMNRKPDRKTFRISTAALALLIVIGLITVAMDQGRNSAYNLMAEKTAYEEQDQFMVLSVSFAIDFGQDQGQKEYFRLEDPNHIASLFERLKDIKVEKGKAEGTGVEGRSCWIQFDASIYKDQIINGMKVPVRVDDQMSWDITLHESGEVWYGGEHYRICNSPDWEELYKLGISEYDGSNKELFIEWIEALK